MQGWPHSSLKKQLPPASNLLMFISCGEGDTHPSPRGWNETVLALGAGSTFKPASSDEDPWAESQHLHLIFLRRRWGRLYFWVLKEVALPPTCVLGPVGFRDTVLSMRLVPAEQILG